MSLDSLLAYLEAMPQHALGMFARPGHFLGPVALGATAAIIVLHLAWRLRRRDRPLSLRRLRRLIFPRRIFLHRSALQDWAMVLINQGALLFALSAAFLAPEAVAIGIVTLGWEIGLDFNEAQPDLWERIGVSIWFVLAWDFGATLAHYLKHRVPLIWEFHKVHHSAQVLTPMTALRRHPGETLFGGLVVSLCLGLAMGVWLLAFGYFAPYAVFGAWLGIWLWRMLVYNLRHSHVPISFGPFWSGIFFSPLQHQIHHGIEARHQNVNFGHIFSFWDRLFGTLYIPKANERVRVGLAAEELREYRSLGDLYLTPLRRIAVLLLRRLPFVRAAAKRGDLVRP